VLLGDAAHTAHFSIGSGTKLAMEDAIGLVEALRAESDREAAFARYEAVRRPAVERLQELARRSPLWWESFPARLHLPVERLMVAYRSRAGNVPLDRFAQTSPDVVGTALEQYAGEPADVAPEDVTSWVLDHPPTRARAADLVPLHSALDDPWSAAGEALVAQARSTAGVRLTGPPDRPALLTPLDLAERIGLEAGVPTAVEGPAALRDDLAAGLVSGRTDLVVLTDAQETP
jgi:hypothetical protein